MRNSQDTVLVLRNSETTGLVSMTESIQLLKEAYADLGKNRAQVLNRRRMHVPLDSDGTPNAAPTWFQMNVIPGAVPCHGVAALRVNARYVSFPFLGGERRKTFPGGISGFVLVWDMNTRALLGIVQEEAYFPAASRSNLRGGGGLSLPARRRGGRPDRRRSAGRRADLRAAHHSSEHQGGQGLLHPTRAARAHGGLDREEIRRESLRGRFS